MYEVLLIGADGSSEAQQGRWLRGAGYEVAYECIERAAAGCIPNDPDLVVMRALTSAHRDGMPMIVRWLRSRAAGRWTPIIVIAPGTDTEFRVRMLDEGATDVLSTEPGATELASRVRLLLERRDAEVHLRKRGEELAELQRIRDELGSLIVHDIRSPLAAIQSNVEWLKERLQAASIDVIEALDDCGGASRRVLAIAANFLDLQRLQNNTLQLNREPNPLSHLLAITLSQHQTAAALKGVVLDVAMPPEISVNIDSQLIRRVLDNVLDNALRNTPAGGHVRLRADVEPGRTRLRIGNTGPPIPPEDRDRIFAQFSPAQPPNGRRSLGLGLYFCRKAVEAHGGRLYVTEEPSLPTVFNLELPL